MKASSISILYGYAAKKKVTIDGKPQVLSEEQHHLVNLIDSPGHIDFSSEVNSALRLSDGALVLVDVVEGVSPQTHTVIRQAWQEKVSMCLVLNKIDRLIIERELDGQQIYYMLVQIVEQVNSIISELIKADLLESGQYKEKDFEDELEKREQQSFFFPEKGNVAFSSAYDCWAFNLPGFIPNVA